MEASEGGRRPKSTLRVMFEKFDESALRALFFSRYEASRLGQGRIESEHVLLGVLRAGDDATAEIWRAFQVEPEEILARYPGGEVSQVASSAELPLSQNAMKILTQAVEELERSDDGEVRPVHLLLAILRVPECRAAALLRTYGLEYDRVRGRTDR